MKKLITIALLAIGFAASAQKIDTAVKGKISYKIKPLKVRIMDTDSVNHLAIVTVRDNLINSAFIIAEFDRNNGDSMFDIILTISGKTYDNYDGTPEYVATYLKTVYPFIIFK